MPGRATTYTLSLFSSGISKRFISITQTSTISGTIDSVDELNTFIPIPHTDTLSASSTATEPKFQVLGTPSSLLSVDLIPSIPVHVRKGSLISLYTKTANANDVNRAVSTQWETLSPLKSLLYGGFSLSYQEIVSTIPYSVLVSSVAKNFWNRRQVSQKSIVAISLDGRVDWAVLPKAALQAYCGPSLAISLERIPNLVSETLATTLATPRSTTTGLSHWKRTGFNFISGRGQVALVGNGQIYRIILKEGEEYLVNKENLLALSINGASDLSNCVAAYTLPNEFSKNDSLNQNESENEQSEGGFLSKLKKYLQSFYQFSSKTTNSAYNSLVGNNNYVKILGPRNVLIQTNANSQLTNALKSFKLKDNEISNTELQIKDAENLTNPERTTADYLKIATVSNGKVEFKSTENFQDAVKKIQKSGSKA